MEVIFSILIPKQIMNAKITARTFIVWTLLLDIPDIDNKTHTVPCPSDLNSLGGKKPDFYSNPSRFFARSP